MTSREKAIYFCWSSFGLAFTILFGMWWFEPSHVPHDFSGSLEIWNYVLFAALSYIVWHEIVMEIFVWYTALFIKKPGRALQPPEGLRVAYATAFVPGAEPYDVLEKTLAVMVAVDYPHDTWLLDEGDDALAKRLCKRYGVLHYSRKGKLHLNTEQGKFKKKTKGGNYNAWFLHFGEQYDVIAQHDVDFVPKKDFLTRTLGYFSDPEVGFVGTPQVYGNLHESWIARGAAQQTWGFYGFLQQGMYGQDMTLLIGANHLFRVKALKDIDGYTAHITEDMLTGMKFYTRKKWTSVYVPEVLLIGEGPTTWAAYFSQQMRWAYGCMDIFFRHASRLLPKMDWHKIINYVWLDQFYFVGIAQAAGIVLLTLYFLCGIVPADMGMTTLYLWALLMAYQILFQRWLQRFNIDPKEERGMMWSGRIMFIAAWPIYLLAFIGVLRGKKLTYVVTPKGNQSSKREPSLFMPHFILGSITLLDMAVGEAVHHDSATMFFWAALNTVLMYALFFSEALPPLLAGMGRAIRRGPRPQRLHESRET